MVDQPYGKLRNFISETDHMSEDSRDLLGNDSCDSSS